MFFTVAKVRNAFEHVDERLDALMQPDVVSVSDWYISDGGVLRTARGAAKGYGLRVFYPQAGVLIFDERHLDLYRLDLAMFDLRSAVDEAERTVSVAITGRGDFGGFRMELDSNAEERMRDWQDDRRERGHPIDIGPTH